MTTVNQRRAPLTSSAVSIRADKPAQQLDLWLVLISKTYWSMFDILDSRHAIFLVYIGAQN